MLEIDGTLGEGGGQILRTSLALSLVTGEPFRIVRIRGGRRRPGLLAQHLTAVRAAAEIGSARVEGAAKGSSELVFRPGTVRPGRYRFDTGTAGSATLVFQAVLPALLSPRVPAGGVFELELAGGTHNPHAPPFPFLEETFLPLLRRMGARVEAELLRPGFFPAGGGEIRVRLEGVGELRPLELLERGPLRERRATAVVSRLPRHVAERELAEVAQRLGWSSDELAVEEARGSRGPGNALLLRLAFDEVTEVVTAFGERGKPAERVAAEAAAEAQEYLAAGVPVGRHLADQLLLPLALAGEGAGGSVFHTLPPTLHTETNARVIERFLGPAVEMAEEREGRWRIGVASPSRGAHGP